MKLTVAICTWNRAALLDQTLTQMKKLEIPPDVDWELLIINNNCTDDTDTVIARHADALPIRRILESKQGLSNARNRAVAEACGEWILWTDDDVLVDTRWLAEYVDAAKRWPNATVLGGKVLPWFESDPPKWLAENLSEVGKYFALRDLGDEETILERDVPYGANVAFRTAIIKTCRFDPNFGRTGDKLISGEEFKMLTALRDLGHTIVWIPTAKVHHFLPKARLTLEYLKELHYCAGRYQYQYGRQPNRLRYIAKMSIWGTRWLLAKSGYLLARVCSRRSSTWLFYLMKANHLQGRIVGCWEGNKR